MKIFVFFYFFNVDIEQVMDIIPVHREYWQKVNAPDYYGGPFGDRSGGMIHFSAPDLENALAICEMDPFVTAGILEQQWVREWVIKD